jgi:hypothetical protein
VQTPLRPGGYRQRCAREWLMVACSGSSTIRLIGSSGRQLGGLNSWSSGLMTV